MTLSRNDALALVETVRATRPDAVRLAEAVSLAARVEPELLREARVRLLPEIDAGAEADLWFSPLVQSASPVALVLLPQVADLLRRRLAQSGPALRRARELLERVHANAPEAIRLEEEVTASALAGGQRAAQVIEEKLMSVVSAIVNQNRLGLARWALRALPRLPEEARGTRAASLLALAAAARLGSWSLIEEQLESRSLPAGALPDLRLFLPPDLEKVPVGVRLLDNRDAREVTEGEARLPYAVEFSHPPSPGAKDAVEVPGTNPLLIEVTWGEDGRREVRHLSLNLQQTEVVEVGATELSIRTAAGDAYLLRETRAGSRPVQIHIWYAHGDMKFRDLLARELGKLRQPVEIRDNAYRPLKPGENWLESTQREAEEWKEFLASGGLLLPLLSPEFLADSPPDSYKHLEKAHAGGVRVIPILVRPCSWEKTPFARFQILPRSLRPLSRARSSVVLREVMEEIEQVVEEAAGPREGAAAPVAAGPPRPGIPPPPPVGYVARRDEKGGALVELLVRELGPERRRQVLLVGPGGAGKTVVAAEAARALLEVYPQRVIWLTAEGRADFNHSVMLDEIALHLGRADLRTFPAEEKAARLTDLLASSPVLVVIDDFETVRDKHEKGLCLSFLKRAKCPGLFVGRELAPRMDRQVLGAMSNPEALELLSRLIESARDPGAFTGLQPLALAEATGRLPLAMQLAVSHIALTRDPRATLDALASGRGEAVTRIFELSFNSAQLGDDGRALLLALSFFVHGATREAAAEVAGLVDTAGRLEEAARRLAALQLISAGDAGGRWRVHGLVRAILKSRLRGAAAAGGYEQRYISYFRAYAEARQEPTPENYDALEAEFDNLLGAMDLAAASRQWDQLLRLFLALRGCLDVRGYWDEAIRRADQASPAARRLKRPEQLPAVMETPAGIYLRRREFAKAKRIYTSILRAYQKAGNGAGVATARRHLGTIALEQGRPAEAEKLYRQSLELARKHGDISGVADNLHNLAIVAQVQGAVERARQLYQEGLEYSQKLGDQRSVAISLHQLGVISAELGDYAGARNYFERSLAINRSLADYDATAATLHQLGLLMGLLGDKAMFEQLLGEALEIFEQLGSPSAAEVREDLAAGEAAPTPRAQKSAKAASKKAGGAKKSAKKKSSLKSAPRASRRLVGAALKAGSRAGSKAGGSKSGGKHYGGFGSKGGSRGGYGSKSGRKAK